MQKVGFEPTPFRNRALIYRLRPLGHFYLSIGLPSLFPSYPILILIIYVKSHYLNNIELLYNNYRMRIIKLEVEVPTKRGGTKLTRQAVSLLKRKYKNIGHFIEYVKRISGFNHHYSLSIDGFAISPFDTVKMLEQNKIYRLSIEHKKVAQPQEQSLQSQDDSEISSEQLSSVSPEEELIQKVSKMKTMKPAAKKKQISSKISQKQNKQVQQSSQSQSQSSEEVPKITKPKIDDTPKRASSKQPQPKPKQIPQSKKILAVKKDNKIKKSVSSESESDDSSSEELPHVPQKPGLGVKTQPAVNKPVLKTQNAKKAVINGQSDSQSSPSPQKEIPQKVKITHDQNNSKLVGQKAAQTVKIPPALRNQNKAIPRKFEQHQADQWLSLDKQKQLQWKERGHKTFCQVPNKIRFKVIEFDEQRFIPVKSGWIKGEVSSVQENGTVYLADVEQEGGKEFKKEYNIPEHNMDELQIWKPLASKEQLEVLLGAGKEKQPEKAESGPAPQQKVVQNDSIQKFICGQVNYYFSDRNYATDFFLQLHANSHPQKYVKLALMLNFPKIKKVLRDQQKLWLYLREDQKYETRNYEIDFEHRLIRKKDIKDPREMHSQNKNQKVEAKALQKRGADQKAPQPRVGVSQQPKEQVQPSEVAGSGIISQAAQGNNQAE